MLLDMYWNKVSLSYKFMYEFSSVIMHNYVHQLICIIDYKHSARYE
jgi:hypothetical protein